jgi:HlyD family secretion protein
MFMRRDAWENLTVRIAWLCACDILIVGAGCGPSHVEPAIAASATSTQPMGVSCLGRITPGDRIIKVAAPPQSIVKALRVQRGSQVRQGQEIAILRDYDVAAAALAQAVSETELAGSTLSQAKAGDKPAAIAAQEAAISRQESILRNAEKDLGRKKDLFHDGLLPGADFEAAQLAVETARQDVRRENELLHSLRQVRSEDVEVAEKKLAVARIKEDYAKADLNRSRIVASASGTVIEIHAYPGETVTDQGILDLGDVGNMFVVAEVYVSDVPRVREGARATITGEGFNGSLNGKVEEILRQASNNQLYPTDALTAADKRVLGVRIRLDDGKKVQHLSNSQVSVHIEP